MGGLAVAVLLCLRQIGLLGQNLGKRCEGFAIFPATGPPLAPVRCGGGRFSGRGVGWRGELDCDEEGVLHVIVSLFGYGFGRGTLGGWWDIRRTLGRGGGRGGEIVASLADGPAAKGDIGITK